MTWLSLVIMLVRLAYDVWKVIQERKNPSERRMLARSFKVVAKQAVEQDDPSLVHQFIDAHGLRREVNDRRRLRLARKRKPRRGTEDSA